MVTFVTAIALLTPFHFIRRGALLLLVNEAAATVIMDWTAVGFSMNPFIISSVAVSVVTFTSSLFCPFQTSNPRSQMESRDKQHIFSVCLVYFV